MKLNIYIIVFGVIAAMIAAAALSTVFYSRSTSPANISVSDLQNYGPAPQIQGISAWINSGPLNLSSLRGKVVLIDFWTYSCINCIREIPHLNAWYNAYGNNGLVIIGVSTPEFQFEHNYSNVYNAVQRFGIKYPVALDNNYSTWDAYGNEYWPAEYLIDKNGDVRYVAFGEGNYNATEEAIRALLVNAGYTVPPNLTSVPLGVNYSEIGSPEMYFGYQEAQGHGSELGNGNGYSPGETVNYTISGKMLNNTFYLEGEWYNAPDAMISVNGSRIFLTYDAKKLNIVAGLNGTASANIIVMLDGQNIAQSEAGSDVRIVNGLGIATVNQSRLYNLVNATSYGWHTVEIEASPGIAVYTFTFG